MYTETPLTRKRKVKTGCKTCKIRRVKCDEGRPACRRCVSTSRVCDGYGIWGGGGTPYTQPQTNRALSVYCTPVPIGSLSDEENVCFDWLIKRTAKKFTGLFASDFWETLIFQASAQEPAVRHAVIALSSAHRFAQYDEEGLLVNKLKEERFTLQQYNKAIQYLRSNNVDDSHSLRVALITCMLFVTLEYLRGQYQVGSAHLRYGMKLLSDVSGSGPRSTMAPTFLCTEGDFAYNALIDAYSRLAIQSAMFGHVPSYMCVVTQDPQTTTIPYIFSSLIQARRTLDDLLNRVHCLKRYHHDLQTPDSPTETKETVKIQTQILTDLTLWRKAYTSTLSRLDNTKASAKDKTGYLLLRVYHEMATIMASVSLTPEPEAETIYDSYTEHFITILACFLDLWKTWTTSNIHETHLSALIAHSDDLKTLFKDFTLTPNNMHTMIETSLLEILEGTKDISLLLQTPDCGGSSFTVETGYIPPVYYTALKCRVPRIRRQAVRTLRAAPHREGVWNGLLLADVLEEIIAVEEGGLYADDGRVDRVGGGFLPRPDDLCLPKVPGAMRVSDVRVILPDDVSGETFVSYRRRGVGWGVGLL
ncbi:uncharacterized protein N7511_009689 [Penicillium nucicola]|uniref:uncharacterized protein n=1 Tax=Penicillium nucicola TaxID=1850975 RepID=UPI0025450613|nr:uncharacterized protein N7511_009689 [Penicillium nucicola]KAJ5747993.1 hypothetical protein N7511_009689 [Penicillium nucicola]